MSFYRLSWHQPKFHQFCPKHWPEIIWNVCVIRLIYQISANNLIIHFMPFEELSYVDCQHVAQYTIDQSINFTNKPSRVVEIIGIRKDAIYEPIPGHQLFFCVWQNAVSNLYIFDHQRVNISLGSMLERFQVDHCDIWSFVKCGFLPSSCNSQFVIMEIIYKHYKLRIEHFSHSLG